MVKVKTIQFQLADTSAITIPLNNVYCIDQIIKLLLKLLHIYMCSMYLAISLSIHSYITDCFRHTCECVLTFHQRMPQSFRYCLITMYLTLATQGNSVGYRLVLSCRGSCLAYIQ